MARAKSPVMGLGASVKNEAIKVSCDVEGKEIFAVFGNKEKGIPMKPCAKAVNDVFSARKLHGVTLMRANTTLSKAGKDLVSASNDIFKNAPISAKYMETFIKRKCAEKNDGKTCSI
jgi:hypothetical protein